jgi:hypothetical protein
MLRRIDAALFSAPGKGIFTFGLSRKPPGRPNRETALSAPRSSAARTPEAASDSPKANTRAVGQSTKSAAAAGVN